MLLSKYHYLLSKRNKNPVFETKTNKLQIVIIFNREIFFLFLNLIIIKRLHYIKKSLEKAIIIIIIIILFDNITEDKQADLLIYKLSCLYGD